MNTLVFIDTNVHLYAFDEADRQKRDAARHWRTSLWRSMRGRTSFQVLQEFYYQANRKFPNAKDGIRAEIGSLLAWDPVQINGTILQHSWDVQDRYRIAFWDALIVAAAQAASCRYLLSEDFQSGQKLAGIEVINPFLRDFDSLKD